MSSAQPKAGRGQAARQPDQADRADPVGEPVPAAPARGHGHREHAVAHGGHAGRRAQRGVQVDGAPVARRALAEEARERDRAQRHQRPRPLGPSRRAAGLPAGVVRGPGRERLGAGHPGHHDRDARDQERGSRRQPGGGRDGPEAGPGEAADAVGAVESGHDPPPELILDRGRLGVHRHVEGSDAGAPAQEDEKQLPGRAGHRGHRQHHGEQQQPGLGHPPRRHRGQHGAGGRHGEHAADRGPEQGQAEQARRQVQARLDGRDPGCPGALGHAQHGEHRGHRQPPDPLGPARGGLRRAGR